MIITFFGHKDFEANEEIEKRFDCILLESIRGKAVDFYLGGYGKFDEFCYKKASEYKERNGTERLIFITPYITESYQKNHLRYLKERYDEIVYPNLERVPQKYAISHRNKYMIEKADLVICYVVRSWGGAKQAYDYAKRKGKKTINLAEYE